MNLIFFDNYSCLSLTIWHLQCSYKHLQIYCFCQRQWNYIMLLHFIYLNTYIKISLLSHFKIELLKEKAKHLHPSVVAKHNITLIVITKSFIFHLYDVNSRLQVFVQRLGYNWLVYLYIYRCIKVKVYIVKMIHIIDGVCSEMVRERTKSLFIFFFSGRHMSFYNYHANWQNARDELIALIIIIIL
jgi:hypothetical protein